MLVRLSLKFVPQSNASLSGVSGKSVLLYAIVFVCRYLDLFTHFISLYNSVMKIIYLVSTFFTLYLIYRKFRATYDRNHDTFRIEFLILPSAVLALLWNHEFAVLEVRVTFPMELFAFDQFRFSGHSPSTWNQSLSCLNYSWLAKRVKQKRSQVIICLPWEFIDFSTFSIGSIVIIRKTSSTGFPLSPVLFKRFSTAISSIFT